MNTAEVNHMIDHFPDCGGHRMVPDSMNCPTEINRTTQEVNIY